MTDPKPPTDLKHETPKSSCAVFTSIVLGYAILMLELMNMHSGDELVSH